MAITSEYAAPRKHQNDDPSRLNPSRCGNNHIAAAGLNQSLSDVAQKNKKNTGEKMSQELAIQKEEEFSIIEQVVLQGDLSKLNAEQRVVYYRKVCESSGLNPFTNPFSYIYLNGKLTLYAKKDCTEQLRKLNGVSIEELSDKLIEDIYIVTAKAKDKNGRIDQAKGAVVIGNLKGEAKANAIMKAETKAKRRVTLSICGMGWTDESEIDSIPNAKKVDVDFKTGEIKTQNSPQDPIEVIETPTKAVETPVEVVVEKFSAEQAFEMDILLRQCDEYYEKWIYNYIKNEFKADKLCDLPAAVFKNMKNAVVINMEKNYAKQNADKQPELIVAEA